MGNHRAKPKHIRYSKCLGRTATVKDTQYPYFNTRFDFDRLRRGSSLYIQVWDSDPWFDDHLGWFLISLDRIWDNHLSGVEIEYVFSGSEGHGRIIVAVDFHGAN